MGYKCHIDVKHNGFYPKGGASATLTIHPVQNMHDIKPLILENKGELQVIGGTIVCSENLQKPQVAERISESIYTTLSKNSHFSQLSKDKYKLDLLYEKTLNPGVGLSIWAKYENTIIGAGTILGKRGVPSETVGKISAKTLIKEADNPATIDSFAADQLVPLLVICPLNSSIRISQLSSHLMTNIDLLQKFHQRKYSCINRIFKYQ